MHHLAKLQLVGLGPRGLLGLGQGKSYVCEAPGLSANHGQHHAQNDYLPRHSRISADLHSCTTMTTAAYTTFVSCPPSVYHTEYLQEDGVIFLGMAVCTQLQDASRAALSLR